MNSSSSSKSSNAQINKAESTINHKMDSSIMPPPVSALPAYTNEQVDLLRRTHPDTVQELTRGTECLCRVVHIMDGDTARVVYLRRNGHSVGVAVVRLARINAPEVHGLQRPSGIVSRNFFAGLVTDAGQTNASLRQFNAGLVMGNTVIMRMRVVEPRDKYGRVVADLWPLKEGAISVSDSMLQSNKAIVLVMDGEGSGDQDINCT